MNLGALLRERSADRGDRAFVIDRGGRYTYAEVERHALGVAARVRDVAPAGSRVALLLGSGEPLVAGFFGAILAGCTAMPVDPRLAAPEVAFLLAHGDVSALVCDVHVPGLAAGVPTLSTSPLDGGARASQSDEEAEVAMMLPTSGSTSSPRVVELTHANVLTNARAWTSRYAIDDRDVIATPLSLVHSFGMTACLVSALTSGASVLLCDDPLPASVIGAIAEHRATVFVAASSFHAWLARSRGVSRASFSSLRLAMGGACALPAAAARAFEEKSGLVVLETYGLTEASPVVTATKPIEAVGTSGSNGARAHGHRPCGVGPALEGVELRVVDGELQVRGPTVMRGYFDNPEATAAALADDGWLRTGDLAEIDASGNVTIRGRLKDLIIRGGEKIYPEEIEGVLAAHPLVADVAVVGVPDEFAGEIPVAFVVGSAEERSLLALCRAHLAAFKVPRRVESVTAIPRNPNGKILRRVLRERRAGAR